MPQGIGPSRKCGAHEPHNSQVQQHAGLCRVTAVLVEVCACAGTGTHCRVALTRA